MKTIIDKANTRGYFNHGWLKTYHTFSFADYYNPRRIHFGALRVLNDDTVAPGEGFGMHPHKNMEVVVDMILYFAGFPGERLKVRAHQFDVNGIVVLPSDGELISRIDFL